jgi:ribosomal protein S6
MEERQYDLIFICRPDTPEADIDKVIATLEHTATEKGARSRRPTSGAASAWPTACRLREGFYVYMDVRSANGEVVKELERRLKVADR